jgi:hypothetical protein
MSEETVSSIGLVDVAVLDDDLDFRNYIEDLLADEGKPKRGYRISFCWT